MAFKLTSFDYECARMVESLTGHECTPEIEADTYILAVDFSDIESDETVEAIFKAIEGRVGNRYVGRKDDTENRKAKVYVKLEDSDLPEFIAAGACDADKDYGVTFCRRLGECKALQVRRDNVKRLIHFVGNGELEAPEEGPAVFIFCNAFGGVYCRALEGDYIQFVRDGLYAVIPRENFEALWEPR